MIKYFLIILVSTLTFLPTGDEEHYMLPHNLLDDYAPNRLFFDIISAPINMGAGLIAAKIALALFFAFVLDRIYTTLEIPATLALLHLVVFLAVQSIYNQWWMLLGWTPSSIAWALVLLAFSFSLRGQSVPMVVALIAATYMHVLVGGYAALFLALTTLDRNFAIYAVAILPLVVAMFGNATGTAEDVRIYTEVRNPHHTQVPWSGIVLTVIISAAMLAIRTNLSYLAALVLSGSLVLQLLFPHLLAGRAHSFGLFVAFLVVVQSIHGEYLIPAAVIIAAAMLVNIRYGIARSVYNYLKWDDSIIGMADYIRQHTPPDAVFLHYLTDNPDGYLDFSRRADRKRYSVWKFIPTRMDRMQEWHDRQARKMTFPAEAAYIVTDAELDRPVIHKSGKLKLYKNH